jgi:hypothetical protein
VADADAGGARSTRVVERQPGSPVASGVWVWRKSPTWCRRSVCKWEGRLYYDVEIRRNDGKKVVAGRAVRDKREAEWLAATIKRALGS